MATCPKSGKSSPPPTPPYVSPNRRTPSPEPEIPPRPSSPDICPICLDKLSEQKDRCYSDNCTHQFCYICLLEWSKNKRECPLCKQPFKSIIHNIKSYNQYEVHRLPQLVHERPRDAQDYSATFGWISELRRMYLHRPQRLEGRNPLRPATSDYRRFVYAYELYCEGVQPPSGFHRYREISPEFFRRNPATLHRLVPWLNRELVAILPHRDNVQYVQDFILNEIKRVDLRSEQFKRSVQPFLLQHTDHFLHEFYVFAVCPLDIAGFDKYARYPRRPRAMIASQYRSTESFPSAPATHLSSFRYPAGHNNLSSSAYQPSNLASQLRTRWDQPPSNFGQTNRLTPLQRQDVNRLERSLRSLDGGLLMSDAGSISSLSDNIGNDEHLSRLFSRIRSILNHNSYSSEETEERSMSSHWSDSIPGTSSTQYRTAVEVLEASSSSDEELSQTKPLTTRTNQPSVSGTQRTPSPTSSHSSDIIFVEEKRPYRQRTPIEISSSDDDQPVIFKAASTMHTRRLSASSDSSYHSPKKAKSHNRKRARSPNLSEISDCETESSNKVSSKKKLKPAETSDSDCLVTYEASQIPKKSRKHKSEELSVTKSHKRCRKRRHSRDKKRGHSETETMRNVEYRLTPKCNQKSSKCIKAKHCTERGDSSLSDYTNRNQTDELSSEPPSSKPPEKSSAPTLTNGAVSNSSSDANHSTQSNRNSETSSSTSEQGNNRWYLDYSQDNIRPEDKKNKNYNDFHKHIRYFAKTHIAEKYSAGKTFKKHHKGHKKSDLNNVS